MIGKRIARLRQEIGWTQQTLAGRLAVSRVAISQIELNLTLPSERTITLMAGLFKLSPQALVEGTTYPLAKTERLPEVTCCYTALERDLALLENDLAWLERLADDPSCPNKRRRLAAEVEAQWMARLETWREQVTDEPSQALLQAARQKLQFNTKGTKDTKEKP